MEGNIHNIITNLNQEIHESGDFIDLDLLEYSTNGYGERIDFLGQQIWSSEDDGDRVYNEETDQYEPMDLFLRRTINTLIEWISKINLKEEGELKCMDH